MFTILRTEAFMSWAVGLKDGVAKARIAARIERLGRGLFGDVKPVGGGVSELRIDHGPGYRVYFVQRGQVVIVLLGGGTKRSQARDIDAAIAAAADLEE
jgi:putative addiction module killer protein